MSCTPPRLGAPQPPAVVPAGTCRGLLPSVQSDAARRPPAEQSTLLSCLPSQPGELAGGQLWGCRRANLLLAGGRPALMLMNSTHLAAFKVRTRAGRAPRQAGSFVPRRCCPCACGSWELLKGL